MTPEEKQLLEKIAVQTEENNEILRSIRRGNRFTMFFQFVYWIAILLLSYGAYVYIQPYINPILDGYSQLKTSLDNVQKVGNEIPNLGKVINSLQR